MERPCSQCGGKLAGVTFERTVVCSYCQTSQQNLDCIAVGQELVHDDGMALALATVVACRGPDKIDVTGPKTLKLEDVTPVTRPPDTLAAGTLVYCKGVMGWERTWTATAAKRGSVKVKHADAAFQDDFFNHEVSLGGVRIPAKATERHHRTAGEALLEEARGDPLGTGVKVIVRFAFLAFGLLFAAIAAVVLYGIITG